MLCTEHPTFAHAFARRAYVYQRSTIVQHIEASLVDYTRAITLRPDVATYYAARSYLQPDTAAKLADITHALDLNPESAEYYAFRGDYHGDLGNHESAIADYSQALALQPRNVT